MGLVTGLGAATADALYGSVAAFGLTAVSLFLMESRWWLALLGGGFLVYLGWRTAMSRAGGAESKKSMPLHGAAYMTTLFLTLTNPATILSFIAIFASVGLGAVPDMGSASLFVLGVFVGSAAWWLILSTVVGALRQKVGPGMLRTVNIASGGVLIGFGVYAVGSALVWF